MISVAEISEIVKKANSKLGEYKKINSIVRDEIFKVLEKEARVIYYPIKDDEICGFVYSYGKEKIAYINTYIPYEKQVFTAAHELYHFCYSNMNQGELLYSEVLEGKSRNKKNELEDLKANRFAAEFLAQEDIFRRELKEIQNGSDTVDLREIVQLMDIFLLPYKTIVNRLNELQIIDSKEFYKFIKISDRVLGDGVLSWQKRLGLCTLNNARTKEIKLYKLNDIALSLYEKRRINYEKLEYLLGLSDTTPKEFNIKENIVNKVDESEIDRIMEE